MSEYTPTMERLRREYIEMREARFGFSDLYAEEWDRALAAHDAEVREAERERAALHAEEGYRLGEHCDDIARRIRSGEPVEIAARPVVPEEPEWEYGTESRFERSGAVVSTLGWGTREQAESVASERNAAEKDEDDDVRLTYMVVKRVPATSPGPWLPVEREEE